MEEREFTVLHLARSVQNAAGLKESAKLRASLSEFAKAFEDMLSNASTSSLAVLIDVCHYLPI
jgi:hypothetical protein